MHNDWNDPAKVSKYNINKDFGYLGYKEINEMIYNSIYKLNKDMQLLFMPSM